MFSFIKKPTIMLLITCLIAGLASVSSGCSENADTVYMRKAAEELIDVLWNVDYNSFTPEKTTAFAKKYYDKDFLKDYESDILYNAGVNSIIEEKFISKVLSKEDKGTSAEDIGDTTYQKYRMKTQVEIISYKPVYAEESIFEEGKKYNMIFTLYFTNENGRLKLSAFGYEPENGVFLPKKANNVPLTEAQQNEFKKIAKEYSYLRYHYDYQNYDPKAVISFYEKNATRGFMDVEELSIKYIKDFYESIKKYKIKAEITSFEVIYADKNKTALNLQDGVVFYYLVSTEIKYKLNAAPEYFKETQLKEGQEMTIREVLGFDFENGKPKIAFAEYE